MSNERHHETSRAAQIWWDVTFDVGHISGRGNRAYRQATLLIQGTPEHNLHVYYVGDTSIQAYIEYGSRNEAATGEAIREAIGL